MIKPSTLLTTLIATSLLYAPIASAEEQPKEKPAQAQSPAKVEEAKQEKAEAKAKVEVEVKQAVEAVELIEPQIAVCQVGVVAKPAPPPGDHNHDADNKDAEKKDDKDSAKQDQKKEKSPEELRKEMQQLESQLANMRNQYQQQANKDREQKQKEARKNAEDIKLPENPTRKQCEAYIAELRESAKNIRSYSSNDPLVAKLKEIPLDHFDLLIDEIGNRTKLRYFANYAMRDTDRNEIRKRFVKSLERSDSAIGVIVMNGWVGDIEEAVRKKIASADGSLDQAWFQAAVELEDPSLYPKLHEITINSRYATQFVGMLESLPDYDIAHTIDTCWRRAEQNKLQISEHSLASTAVKYGNVKALGYLVRQLSYTPSYTSTSSSYTRRRLNVLQYIDYRGSNQDIVKWYDKNKKKLVFDHYRKRFVMRGTSVFEPPTSDKPGIEDEDAAGPDQDSAEQAVEDAAEEVPAVEVQLRIER